MRSPGAMTTVAGMAEKPPANMICPMDSGAVGDCPEALICMWFATANTALESIRPPPRHYHRGLGNDARTAMTLPMS
ncbi:unnamed protein product [Phytophthora fragariaefolia]|uniref:Unnamed protein product n=1 Tax=Phytophthora fragariaefolia TaxID=1490495 RepID=A0A9W6WTU0_9STRA|nr:unnamed protein product [Phytophthora fragariaefolia]